MTIDVMSNSPSVSPANLREFGRTDKEFKSTVILYIYNVPRQTNLFFACQVRDSERGTR